MPWFRSDRELAATKYAGQEAASTTAARKQAARGSMGRGHRSARDADRTGQAWERHDRRRYGG